MKTFVTLFLIMMSLSSFALTRSEADCLLQMKNLSLASLEAKGWKLMPGETTGHGFVSFNKVQAVFTNSQVILKDEIDSASFSGQEVLSSLESLRFSGQYILRQDVKATMIQSK